MPGPVIGKERMAQALSLARRVGDKEAARHYGVHERTIQRWREKAPHDAELSTLVETKKAELDAEIGSWELEVVRTLSIGAVKLRELIQGAGQNQMRDVVGAMKILGELDITRKVMVDGDSGAARQDREPSEGKETDPQEARRATGEADCSSPPLN